jgi:hypothetical protein
MVFLLFGSLKKHVEMCGLFMYPFAMPLPIFFSACIHSVTGMYGTVFSDVLPERGALCVVFYFLCARVRKKTKQPYSL